MATTARFFGVSLMMGRPKKSKSAFATAAGFGGFVFGDEAVQVTFYDQDGAVLYEPSPVKRRTAAMRKVI